MKASISLIISQRPTKKGYPIVVKLFLNDKRKPKKTIGHSKKEDWNFEDNKTHPTNPDHFYLLPIILDYHAKIAKINASKMSFDEANNLLFDSNTEPKEATSKATILTFLDVFINEKRKINHSVKIFEDLKSDLKKYLAEDDMPINSITYEWLNAYKLSKMKPEVSGAGAMTYLKKLKTVYKEAQRRESLKIKTTDPFKGLIKTIPPKEIIDITPKQLKQLLTYKPKKSTTETAALSSKKRINLIFLEFYLAGIDFVDLALLEWKQIKNRRIKFKRYKNRNKPSANLTVDIFLVDEAVEIIDLYGTKDDDRIFSFIPSPITNPIEYKKHRNYFNKSLNNICKNLKIPLITSKSMRYVFRTFAGELFVHDLIVMKLQGHKPQGVTYRYQGKIPYYVQDEQHQKIIDLIRS